MKKFSRPIWLAVAGAALIGCSNDAAKPTTSSASTTAAGKTTSVASAAKPAKLKSANPKDYKKTGEQELGTLPDGVGIAVGQVAPDFSLPATGGKKTSLDDLVKGGEALLVFYRGGW